MRLAFEPKKNDQLQYGFLEHIRPLQFAIVFASDYIAIRNTSRGIATNTHKTIVIIWLRYHGFILSFSVNLAKRYLVSTI